VKLVKDEPPGARQTEVIALHVSSSVGFFI